MINRHIIALNRLKLAQADLRKQGKVNINDNLSLEEIAEFMDFVRRYPKEKIQQDKLFTCGFSKN